MPCRLDRLPRGGRSRGLRVAAPEELSESALQNGEHVFGPCAEPADAGVEHGGHGATLCRTEVELAVEQNAAGASDLLLAPRSLETVARALSVAAAKAKPNSSGVQGAFAMASRASKIPVGFMRIIRSLPETWQGAPRLRRGSVKGGRAARGRDIGRFSRG